MPPPASAGKQANRFRGQRQTRPCAACGVDVTRYLTEQNHDTAWRCSRVCNTAMLQGLPRRTTAQPFACATCGDAVVRTQIRRNRKYCSLGCASAGKIKPLIEKACEGCGGPIKVRPSEAGRLFCKRACWRASQFTRAIDRTHNGRPVRTDRDGYLLVYEPEFSPPSWRGWALEHRVVMAKLLGRKLLSTEEVDHINSDRADNRPENLQVLDKTAHRQKTGADARKKRQTLRDRLAAYEAKYGPLE